MALDPNGSLFKWFKELVKVKMSAIAIPVAGIGISLPVMTFSKMFEFPVGNIVEWTGLALMLFSIGLFGVSSTILTLRSLEKPAQLPPPQGGPDGRFLPREQAVPMDDPSQQPQPQREQRATRGDGDSFEHVLVETPA